MKAFFLLFFFTLSLIAQSQHPMDAQETIQRARRHLGTETALQRVQSLRFTGHVETEFHGVHATIEIVFLKPSSSWLRIETEDTIEITANDRFEGFVHTTDRRTGQVKVKVLPGPVVARLAHSAWERLHFFDAPHSRFGRAEYHGLVRFGTRMCDKVVFRYPGEIWSARYFDKDSGRLVMTTTDTGMQYIQGDEIDVGGIRFPAKLKVSDGNSERRLIRFHQIVVNCEVDPAIFSFPCSLSSASRE